MNSYIVMQGETYREEKRLGILKTATLDKAGTTPHSWERMKLLEKGDRTFHYVKGAIVAVGTIQEKAKASSTGADAYWQAPCEYLELDDALEISPHIESLNKHMPLKYAAFQPDGNGNSGYLYPCNEELALHFVGLLAASKWRQIEQLEFAYDAVRTEKYNSLTAWMMDSEFLIRRKLSRFTEQFSARIRERWGGSCAVCGLENPVLLKAVYSKPWKDSLDHERVDPANGVLLCANHAALYESGQIAFTGIGTLRLSGAVEADPAKYGLRKNLRISAGEDNVNYLRWHRNNVFTNY